MIRVLHINRKNRCYNITLAVDIASVLRLLVIEFILHLTIYFNHLSEIRKRCEYKKVFCRNNI